MTDVQKNYDEAEKARKKPFSVKLFFGLRILSYVTLGITIFSIAFLIGYIFVNGVPYLNADMFGEYTSANVSIMPSLIGTLWVLFTSMIISVPIGVCAAIFLVEYTKNGSRVVKIIRVTLETLAGIPSIVYGLFGYVFFVLFLGFGYSILGGSLTISIMILPVIVRSTEESLLAVDKGFKEGAYALGTSKVRTIFCVILPCASSGIVTSIILAAGRVISESAVLILTIGLVMRDIPTGLMDPGSTLALAIYYFGMEGHPEAAAAAGVVLMLMVLALNLIAYYVGRVLRRKLEGK